MEFKMPANWLEKELALMTAEKWGELYVRLVDRYHLPEEEYKLHCPPIDDSNGSAGNPILHRENYYGILADDLSDIVKTATYEEARDLLLLALHDDVDPDSAHFLCDAALLALINGLMGESDEASQIIEMFHSVYKWYA